MVHQSHLHFEAFSPARDEACPAASDLQGRPASFSFLVGVAGSSSREDPLGRFIGAGGQSPSGDGTLK
jgi:hypothetical protein